jgi:alkylhydroperoxidase family enzyme
LRRLRKLACAGIHVIECAKGLKTWMAGTSPNMTQSAVLWRSATLSLSPKRAYVLCARLCKEDAMTERARMAYYQVAPDALKAVVGVENYIQHCGLEKSLIELVKMRASQINGCAYQAAFLREGSHAASDAQGQRGLIRVSAAVMPALAVKLARTA